MGALAYNPDAQDYLAVWDDWNGENDVTARRIAGAGLPLGDAFSITTASGDQQNSQVAYGAGVYLVVWQDDTTNTVDGQIVGANGVLSGTTFTLSNGGAKAYTYDQANRLKVVNGSGVSVTYAYNGDGARLQQENSGAAIRYTQDLAAPLPVVLQSQVGENTTQYVYALGTRPLAQNSGAWEYLLADALGSVRQIVDGGGNVTLAESYEPYGSVLTSNGTASSIFGYSGEQIPAG